MAYGMLKCLIEVTKKQYKSIKIVYEMKVYYYSGKNKYFVQFLNYCFD